MFTKNRIYYQFKSNHLSTCPLTAHALLHIPNDIRNNRPPCMNWMFVMECWCGSLLPAIKSWKKPFICLAFQQYQAVQYLEIMNRYNLLDLMPMIIMTIYHCNMRGCFNYRKVHVYVLCASTQYLYFLRLYYVLKVSGS